MKQLYTLEEIHRYAHEVRLTDNDLWKAIDHHDTDSKNQIQARLHVMHEVLLRMHESLEQHGPRRPGGFARLFQRPKEKEIYTTSGESIKLDLSAVPRPRPERATTIESAKKR